MGARLALAIAVTGCYGGLAVGPDRGTPDGGDPATGTGVQAFAGGELELPRGGRLGLGVALGQTSIHEDPEGHTPRTTWAVFELRYTHRILPDIPCGPVLGVGGLLGDSSDGSVRGGRGLFGCETRTAPVVIGGGLVPQILWFDPPGNDAEDTASSVRSLHLAAWIARAPRALRRQPADPPDRTAERPAGATRSPRAWR